MLTHSQLSMVTSTEPEFTQKPEVSKPQAQMFPLLKLPSSLEMVSVTSDLSKILKIGSYLLMKPQFKLVNTTTPMSSQEPMKLISVEILMMKSHTTQKLKIHSHKNTPSTVGYYPTKLRIVLMEDKTFSELSLTVKTTFLKTHPLMNGLIMNSKLIAKQLETTYWSETSLMVPLSSTLIPSEYKMPDKTT